MTDTEIQSLFSNLTLPAVKLTKLEQDLAAKVDTLDFKNPTIKNITQVIYLNAKTRRPAEAQSAFDYMMQVGVKPDLVAYNNLMAAYASCGNLGRTQELFDELKGAGMEPDMVTYSILINSAVFKDIDLAFMYYEEYRKLGKPNQIILATLIKGSGN